MSDTQQAAKEHRDRLTRAIDDMEKTSVCMEIFDRAVREAEQRGEQRGMERAAGMVEGEYWGWTPQALARAIRAAKEAR